MKIEATYNAQSSIEQLPDTARSNASINEHVLHEKEDADETISQQTDSGNENPIEERSLLNATLIILATFLGMITVAYSTTAGTIALGDIGRSLQISQEVIQWVQSALALSSGCFLLLCGRLADIYGRKRMYIIGSLWTAIWALGCGFAQTGLQLFIMRGFQGIGLAAIVPASIGIMAHSFPPSFRRTIAFALFSAGNPSGAGLAYVTGALVTQFSAVKWRGVFFLDAGLAVLTFIIGWLVFDADLPTTEVNPRVDWFGASLVTLGLVLIMFALGEGPVAPNGFATAYIIVLLIVGVLLVGAFLAWEHYLVTHTSITPLMRLEIWTRANWKFSAMALITFLQSCAFFAWILWAFLYYQDFLKLSSIQSMIRYLPMVVTGLTLNVVVGITASKVDIVWLCVLGTFAGAISALLLAIINPAATYWAYGFPAFILSVWAADFVFACGTLFFAKVAHPHEQSVAGGIFQTVIQLATSFGLAITTIVHDGVLSTAKADLGLPSSTGVDELPSKMVLKAYQSAQWTVFGFNILALILSVLFLRGIGIVGHQKAKVIEPKTPSDDTSRCSEKL